MKDVEAINKAMRLWDRGYAFLPKSGWRKVEGGIFYPTAEEKYGEIFTSDLDIEPIFHNKYNYEVGYFVSNKRTIFKIIGRGMTWEEAFNNVNKSQSC